MSNHLKNQSSPYLLQHSDNPVDWYPWCEEPFERAKRENKPVFLSVGYSTCHWCHVMAHESFEDEKIADILNQHFISIKVDREERPDIDSVYMTVCQAFTGRGGWPMSIFMTAEQKPFFAGTYFPVESRHGMIGFRDLLLTIAEKWDNSPSGLLKTADLMVESLNPQESAQDSFILETLPELAAKHFSESFDWENGGFGLAPKFPTPHNLLFLLLYSRQNQEKVPLEQVRVTLDRMRRGGIFDQIGYGFSRYSTDSRFLIPHFEKMLYDNALLIMAYSVAYKATGEEVFLDTAEKTAEYIFREMTGPDGEFYSAQDADSEGEEGKYYVWHHEEICTVLGMEAGECFCAYFDITKEGNFEGGNIPNLLNGNEITEIFRQEIEMLYRYRKSRMGLHLDDKILTAWNALMICAMAMLYRVTGRKHYLEAAKAANDFVEDHLVREDLLLVSCRDGAPSVNGFLDEYAYYACALLFLYDVTSDAVYLDNATKIYKEAKRQFLDEKEGGFFLYGKENEHLIARPKETYDGALPSGNSVMAYCLVRLSQLTDNPEIRQDAEKQLAFLSAEALHAPEGHSMFLLALLMYQNPPQRITVVPAEGDSREEMLKNLPIYADIKILPEETREYTLLNDKTTYYICKDQMCLPPTN